MSKNETNKAGENRPKGKRSCPRKASLQAEELTREEIKQRAYVLFLARGSAHGHDLEDWLQAERELREGHKIGKDRSG